MASIPAINEPTPDIAAEISRWQKNRAFINGSDAVKARGEAFLPKVRWDDSPAEYQAHLKRTNFYPAVQKIAQGISGLIGRKKAQLNSTSASVQLLSQLITPDGRSLEQLGGWLVRETQITNFTGLLIDEPSRAGVTDLSAANAYARGFRPFISGYCAENILEVTQGIVGARVQLTNVRLLEDDGTKVRQLLMNDAGAYEVRLWQQPAEGADWQMTLSHVPNVNGRPLDAIPFTLVNVEGSLSPTPALLEPSVDINLEHYVLSGNLAAAIQLTGAPISVVTGYTPKLDENGNDPFVFDVSAGAVWKFEDENVEVKWFTYDPTGQDLLLGQLKDKKDELSAIGHTILAPEKAAPEAPETQMIRRAAENAALGTFTNAVGGHMQAALRQWAAWVDPQNSDLEFSLNTDFMPGKMSAPEAVAWSAMRQAGQISEDTFLLGLRDNGWVSPTLDVEAEKAATSSERKSLTSS